MSRERYQARSKVVQKLGRDGLVEQNRATGQEQRVSKRDADIYFGPERQQVQKTDADAHRHLAQKKKLERTMRQEYAEFRSATYEQEIDSASPEHAQEEYHASMRTADDVPAEPIVHEPEGPRPAKHRQEKRSRKLRMEPEQRLTFEEDRGQALHFEADRTQETRQDSPSVPEKRETEYDSNSGTFPASPAPETAPSPGPPDGQGKRQHRRIQYHQENTAIQQEQRSISTDHATEPTVSMSAVETPADPHPHDIAVGVSSAEQPEAVDNPLPDTDRPFSFESENGPSLSPEVDNRSEHILPEAPRSSIPKEQPARLRFDDGERLRFEHGQQAKPPVADVRAPPRRQRTNQPESHPDSHKDFPAPKVRQEQSATYFDAANTKAILPEPDNSRQEGSPSEYGESPVSKNADIPPPIRRLHDEGERAPRLVEHRQRLRFETGRETPVSVKKKRRAVPGEQAAKEVLPEAGRAPPIQDGGSSETEVGNRSEDIQGPNATITDNGVQPSRPGRLRFEESSKIGVKSPKDEQDERSQLQNRHRRDSYESRDTVHGGNAGRKSEDSSVDASAKRKKRLRFESQGREQSGPRDENASHTSERSAPTPPRKSRLHFEDDAAWPQEEAPPVSGDGDKKSKDRRQRNYEKAEKRVENAEKRLESAESKLPKKRRLRMEKEPDVEKGKVRRRLRFEEEVIPQGTPPPLPIRAGGAALRTAGSSASLKLHREIRKSEHENVAVEAAHKLEFTAERQTGRFMRWSRSRLKSRPYRAVRQAEQKLTRERGNLAWQTVRRDNPQFSTTPLSRWRQKRAIKRQYAAARRKQGQAARQGVRLAVSAGEKVTEIIVNNKKTFLIVGALFLIFTMFSSMMTSCSAMLQGGTSALAISTYPSEDEDMLAAEAQYTAMEAELQSYLDNYESTHDYDEYSYDLDDIEHDPYVLISMLTAIHGGAWTIDDVQDTLQALFERQYTLTETVETETKTRTVDGEEEEYEYKTCTVKLENADLSHLPVYVMGEEPLSMYAVYIGCLGNRPDLFPDSGYVNRYVIQGYTDYEIPTEALEDETFAAMIEEAEKYLGYPYVWGGASPSTSFDCSGFVSWVINQSGWDVGRLTAQGLHDICTATSTPHPGDLVFFTGTYDAGVPVTHVGLYVGDGWMIHAGDPISYCHFAENSYYMGHLYGYGHLP